MTVRANLSAPQARKPTPGARISAKDIGQIRSAAHLLMMQRTLRSAVNRSWSEVMLHAVAEIFPDYLECLRVWRSTTLGSEIVYVARPARLRSELSRDGVTYVYTDAQTRTASKAGETDELQLVTTGYLVGDLIEVTVSRGATGIPQVDEQRGRPIDTNVDGRAWATVPA